MYWMESANPKEAPLWIISLARLSTSVVQMLSR
jgi:hypothetical protein